MFKNFLSLLLIVNIFFTNTAMADIEENRWGELVSSDFKNIVNSSLPWCKKKGWGGGYKTDNCWAESAWFENISDNFLLKNYKTLPNLVNGYAGEWKDNKFHGKGVQIFSDRIIVGNWQENDISFGTILYFDQKTQLKLFQGVRVADHSDPQYVFGFNNDNFLENPRRNSYREFRLMGNYYGIKKNQNKNRFVYHGEIKDLQPHGKGEISVQAASNAYAISMHGRSDGYSELYGASNDGLTYPFKIAGNFKDGKLIDKAKFFFKNNNNELPDLELDISFANDGFFSISVNQMKTYCGESEILFSGNILLPASDKHSHFTNLPVLPNQMNSSESKEIWQMAILDDEYIIKYDYGDFFISVISSKNLKKIDKELIQDLSIQKRNQIFSADIKEIGAECYPNNAIDFNKNKPSTIISSKGTYTGGVRYSYINNRNRGRNIIGYVKNGKGTIEYTDGSVFKGEWLNDMKDGYGEFIKKDGTVIRQEWVLGENINQIIMQEKAKQKRLAQIEKEILLQKGANLELNPENLKKCERFFNEYMKPFLYIKKLDRYQYNIYENIGKEHLLNCLKDPNLYLYSF